MLVFIVMILIGTRSIPRYIVRLRFVRLRHLVHAIETITEIRWGTERRNGGHAGGIPLTNQALKGCLKDTQGP
jgi:hypothetical protein